MQRVISLEVGNLPVNRGEEVKVATRNKTICLGRLQRKMEKGVKDFVSIVHILIVLSCQIVLMERLSFQLCVGLNI